jgi:hypothetical protein
MQPSQAPATETTDTTTAASVELPGDIHFILNSTFNKLIYDKLEMNDVICKAELNNKILTIKTMSMKLLNGSMVVNGHYNAQNPEKPSALFNLNLNQIDIQQAVGSLGVLEKYVNVAKHAKGSFSGALDLSTTMDNKMNLDYASLLSSGNLDVPNMTISGFNVLDKIASALQMEKYRSLSISNIHPSYTISGGRLSLNKPLEFKVDNTDFSITGSTGLDKSLDYDIAVRVPSKELQSQANNLLKSLAPGVNAPLGDKVTVYLKLTGTTNDPKIKTSLKDMAKDAKNNLKDQAKQELQNQQQKLQDQAKQELEKQKQQLQQQAQQELDKQKKELEEQAKKEQERLKKQMEEEARKNLKKIFR